MSVRQDNSTLPVGRGAYNGTSAILRGVPATRDAELRCLVVDDEPRLRQALVRFMEGEGFTCFEAGTGHEALAVLDEEPVALLLSDMKMPGGMEGIDLLRIVRKRDPDIAVVMITAVADVDVAVSCLSLGAMDYLTKPFTLEEVRARAAQALEKRRLIIENRHYQQQLESRITEQGQRIENLFLASIASLADALELKDPYTRGHSNRVSLYATEIATAMGLDHQLVRQIELGGHLHDLGKIGVRETVLNKPCGLTDEEYQHVMTHPVTGWRVLTPLFRDTPVVLNVVRSHHEKYDGSGTPDGVAALDIPLEARITSVADAFDAMVSARPYRSGLPVKVAIAELRRHAGTQFDPEVVPVFTALLESGLYERAALEVERATTEPLRVRLPTLA